jgi:hypothetical protein
MRPNPEKNPKPSKFIDLNFLTNLLTNKFIGKFRE